jgi:hypothetical protein
MLLRVPGRGVFGCPVSFPFRCLSRITKVTIPVTSSEQLTRIAHKIEARFAR